MRDEYLEGPVPSGLGTGAILLVIAAVPVVLHLLTAGAYGVFRDEFYYLACADRLAWGYVDQPPLSILILAGWTGAFGDSVLSLRFLPALLGGVLVWLAGALAGELGGGRAARILAAAAALIAPLFIGISGIYSMNIFDFVIWSVAFLLLARILKGGDGRLWILLGLVLGLGLLNKIGVLVLGAGMTAALLLSPHRRQLKEKWIWIGGAVAGLLFLPHLLWQAANGWPTREFIARAQAGKILEMAPHEFFLASLIDIHPVNAPIWLLGLGALLFWGRLRPYRPFGLIYLFAFAIFVLQNSKAYYLGPSYPILLAAGACTLEHLLHRSRWAKEAILVVLVLAGMATAPLAAPILPVGALITWQELLGVAPATAERHAMRQLPQFFADRFGWEEMTGTVAEVYRSLPPEQRAAAAIFTSNYGEAGAIAHYGRKFGLPPAISGHNNYWLWGPGEASGDVLITVGFDDGDFDSVYREQRLAAEIDHPYAMQYETGPIVHVVTGRKLPIEELWPLVKHYN